ncbi:type VII secretion integral membrane protein EccD [Mycolicibacterium celeriflavum]|nr:type VII secretion integral membrane protein EccD [Mycolicibacterium celeriflavum]MCV7236810.1 type VII secretion integral membrane protein EccD [Mycolicibacterium celeriflavum]ORA49687.1 type VII secretion integral membrane protein EccD [Mycolicibacterium celeriflavum]
MPDSLCRVAVHVGTGNDTQTIDLALPDSAVLGDMLPSIVELVHPDHRGARTGRRWRLRRIDGRPLDESLTMRDNQVRDGELLWLTTDDVPAPVLLDRDSSRTVAGLGPSRTAVPTQLCVGGALAAACIGAAAIIWSARSTEDAAPFVTAAGLTAAAALAAQLARRAHAEPSLFTAFSAIAVILAAVTGVVVVPAGPPAAHLLLASAAALSVAVLQLRFASHGHTALTVLATTALLCTAASATAIACNLAAATSGALLATLALAALSSAPRLVIMVTRIGPGPPDADDTDPLTSVGQSRATLAHDTLTGIVIGTSLAAAMGTVLVGCVGDERRFPVPATVFTIVVGVTLLLRTRIHIGVGRRCALAVCGFAGVATGFALTAIAVPHHAHWLGALAAVAGTSALMPLVGITPSLTARRAAEIVEYVALAAVIPLACWIAGVFDLVRNLALT